MDLSDEGSAPDAAVEVVFSSSLTVQANVLSEPRHERWCVMQVCIIKHTAAKERERKGQRERENGRRERGESEEHQ